MVPVFLVFLKAHYNLSKQWKLESSEVKNGWSWEWATWE